MRACAPIVYDPWDGTHLNANTAVLARSGSGKSFATKLGVLRGLCRGVVAYVIDPEGEYADMARSAGGRVLSPGVVGQGMNPFVIDRADPEELLQRIGSLRRLIEVMVGERLSAERRAALDHALAGYYARPSERTGFRDFYGFLEENTPEGLSKLLRPFATGSLRRLLSDEGYDLLRNETLVTVFDLRLLEPELRPAAAMVCTETVWAAAARDPKPRLLVVDEVWSIMQHPEGAAFHGLDGQARPQASPRPAVHHPGRARPALRGHLAHNHGALGTSAVAERRVQALAAAGRGRDLDRRRRVRPACGFVTLVSLSSKLGAIPICNKNPGVKPYKANLFAAGQFAFVRISLETLATVIRA